MTVCRSLVAELGVELEGPGTALVDHSDFVRMGRRGHAVTACTRLINSTAILGGYSADVGALPMHLLHSEGCTALAHACTLLTRADTSAAVLRRRQCCLRALRAPSPRRARW